MIHHLATFKLTEFQCPSNEDSGQQLNKLTIWLRTYMGQQIPSTWSPGVLKDFCAILLDSILCFPRFDFSEKRPLFDAPRNLEWQLSRSFNGSVLVVQNFEWTEQNGHISASAFELNSGKLQKGQQPTTKAGNSHGKAANGSDGPPWSLTLNYEGHEMH